MDRPLYMAPSGRVIEERTTVCTLLTLAGGILCSMHQDARTLHKQFSTHLACGPGAPSPGQPPPAVCTHSQTHIITHSTKPSVCTCAYARTHPLAHPHIRTQLDQGMLLQAGMQLDKLLLSVRRAAPSSPLFGSGVHRLEIMAERCAPPRNHGIRGGFVSGGLCSASRTCTCDPPYFIQKGGSNFFLSARPHSRANALPIKQPSIPVVCQQGESSRYDSMGPRCALNPSAGRRRRWWRRRRLNTSPHKSWWRRGLIQSWSASRM
jgi:hypothetical protein